MDDPARLVRFMLLVSACCSPLVACGHHRPCDWYVAEDPVHVQPVLLTEASMETVSSCILSIARASPQVQVRAEAEERGSTAEGLRFVLWMADVLDFAHPTAAGVTRVYAVDGRPALYLQDMIVTVTSEGEIDRRIISFVEQPMTVLAGYHTRGRRKVPTAYPGLNPTGELTRQVRDYVSGCLAGREGAIDLSQGIHVPVDRLRRCR